MSGSTNFYYTVTALALVVMILAVYVEDAIAAPDGKLFGTLTNRYDYYDRSGDSSGSLFPSSGGQFYSEANLNFYRRFSAYETVSGNLFGVLNDSDYRGNHKGFILERGQLSWEKGDGWVPFRSRLGDFFGFFSPRTIQRTLKGGQVEFQSRLTDDVRSSVLLFSGLTDATYHDLNNDETVFNGASLFLGSEQFGSYTLNLVHNRDESLDNARSLEQLVGSVAGEVGFRLYRQQLTLEGELGLFDGDHSSGSAAVENSSDMGVFLRFSGRDWKYPVRYAASFERYGENYRPKGGIIVPDRSSADFNLGYTFAGGLAARLRLQRFEDGLESGNSTISYVNGLNLSGRLVNPFVNNLTMFFDSFVQRSQNRDGTIDTDSFQSSLNLAAPLDSRWIVNLGMFYRMLDNHFNGNNTWTGELRGSVDHQFDLGRFSGRVLPGLILRQIESNSTNRVDIDPSIAVNFGDNKHDLSLHYQTLLQNGDGTADLVTHHAGLTYGYKTGRHQFGVDLLFNSTEPDSASSTESYRVGAFYTFNFDKLLLSRPEPLQTEAFNDPLGPFAQYGPGSSLVITREAFTDAGISSGVSTPDSIIYDARIIDTIDQRQRLVVLSSAGLVDKIAVVIDFDDTGRPDSAARIFGRVREALIRRLGAPQTSYETGEFGPNFTADVIAGRFTRVDEWYTGRGVLRLGIPQRLDGQVRIEIQHAKRFPQPQRTLWSIENVR